MAIGGEYNAYASTIAYHISNSDFTHLLTTGKVTLGSELDNTVTGVFIDGAEFSLSASRLNLVASQGRILVQNTSSHMYLTANAAVLNIKATSSISILTNLSISTVFGADGLVTFVADSDCSVSDGDRFEIDSSAVLTINTSSIDVVVSTPTLEVNGSVDITSATSLTVDGVFVRCSLCVSVLLIVCIFQTDRVVDA